MKVDHLSKPMTGSPKKSKTAVHENLQSATLMMDDRTVTVFGDEAEALRKILAPYISRARQTRRRP